MSGGARGVADGSSGPVGLRRGRPDLRTWRLARRERARRPNRCAALGVGEDRLASGLRTRRGVRRGVPSSCQQACCTPRPTTSAHPCGPLEVSETALSVLTEGAFRRVVSACTQRAAMGLAVLVELLAVSMAAKAQTTLRSDIRRNVGWRRIAPVHTSGVPQRSVQFAVAMRAENGQRTEPSHSIGLRDNPSVTDVGVRRRLHRGRGMGRTSRRIGCGLNACVGGKHASHRRVKRGARAVTAPAVPVGTRRLRCCFGQSSCVLTAFRTDLAHKRFQPRMRNPASGWQRTPGLPSALDVPDRDPVPKLIGKVSSVPRARSRVTRLDDTRCEVPGRGADAEA